ncbi:TIGR02391 family protein [Streptomyces sp. SP18CM02]|uniref:TIGR02391 family protein n=1 Tax=Streptomyces sp. SP18CM02 TaxID=2758571 RepID=UPI00168B1531|nr:TIGR02391 family protein [Streptomyces sp. SP18CM02]MBD3550850.1 restriction endonuclease [Streptomyces sp. SP18CM02]
MTQINHEWAIGKLESFIRTAAVSYDRAGGWRRANPLSVVQAEAQIVEHILDRVLPVWRTAEWPQRQYSYWRESEAATRAIAQLQAEQELAENLGTNAPQLDASTLHPWVWGSVQGLWGSGHYRQAVGMAAVAVNAQAQAKIGRKDLSEWKLLTNAFGLKDPEPGEPRLRLAPKEDSDTWRSRHEGAAAFARGVYAGIRNPIAHEAGDELEENEALEQLAAFSILARWIDTATVEKAL